VDEDYMIVRPTSSTNFGREALEEIMSFMNEGEVVINFAEYTESMKKVIGANEGFRRRVMKIFYFDEYSPLELAEMLQSKIKMGSKNGMMKGYKLHPSCTPVNIAELILAERRLRNLGAREMTTKELRSRETTQELRSLDGVE
jgi:hypothetical protein